MNHERSIVSIKQIHHHALKDISEALEQLPSSKDISEDQWVSRIIMQLCEDSLTFKNFRSWYFIQTASKTK